MDNEKESMKIIRIVAGIIAFIGIAGLYLNINSAIGMFFDYRKATLMRILFDVWLIITAIYLLKKVKDSG